MRLTIFLFSLLILSICTHLQAAEKHPNVVLIIADDQVRTDYGFMGHPLIQTPSLDKLAARGALFTRGYVPTALCRPSLATLDEAWHEHFGDMIEA